MENIPLIKSLAHISDPCTVVPAKFSPCSPDPVNTVPKITDHGITGLKTAGLKKASLKTACQKTIGMRRNRCLAMVTALLTSNPASRTAQQIIDATRCRLSRLVPVNQTLYNWHLQRVHSVTFSKV